MADEIVNFEPINAPLARALEELSVNQALAMNCLMSGGTMNAAAEAADVSRRALYKWLEPGEPLCEAIAIWKQDLATTARTRLLMMTDLATQNILSALKRGDARLAMQLVQKLGVLDAPPVGPTRSEAVTEQVTSRTRERSLSQTVHVRAASFVEQWTEVEEEEGDAGRGTEALRHGGTKVGKGLELRGNHGKKKGNTAGENRAAGEAGNARTAGSEYGAIRGDERGDREGGGAEAVGASADAEASGAGAGGEEV